MRLRRRSRCVHGFGGCLAMRAATDANRSAAAFAAWAIWDFSLAKTRRWHRRDVESRPIQASGALQEGVLTPVIVSFGVLGRNCPMHCHTLAASPIALYNQPLEPIKSTGKVVCTVLLPQDSLQSTKSTTARTALL